MNYKNDEHPGQVFNIEEGEDCPLCGSGKLEYAGAGWLTCDGACACYFEEIKTDTDSEEADDAH